jgi:DNA-binding SARP family transcriptional activator/TolB-like protein
MVGKPSLRLAILGRFRAIAHCDGTREIRIGARKGRALLAYLALHPDRMIDRETLADLLWGDRFDTQARQSLRQCLKALRQDLDPFVPGVLRIEPEAVGLHADVVAVDALELAVTAESADLASISRAVDLYRGELLARLDTRSEPFQQWLQAERSRLETKAAALLRALAERSAEIAEQDRALVAAERLAALDPLHEDWQCVHLALCARFRGREAALRAARSLTGRLKAELGIVPQAATRRLIAAIEQAEPVESGGIVRPPRLESPRSGTAPAVSAAAPVSGALASDNAALVTSRAATMRRLAGRSGAFAGGIALAVAAIPALIYLVGHSGARHPPRQAAAAVDRAGACFADPGHATIAVLRFDHTGGDDRLREIADDLGHDVINALARAARFRVISPHASFVYHGIAGDPARIGAELGVKYAVEGRVRRDGEKFRINVALIEAATRLRVWSDSLELAAADRAAATYDAARGIARHLHLAVGLDDGQNAGSEGLNPQANALAAISTEH